MTSPVRWTAPMQQTQDQNGVTMFVGKVKRGDASFQVKYYPFPGETESQVTAKFNDIFGLVDNLRPEQTGGKWKMHLDITAKKVEVDEGGGFVNVIDSMRNRLPDVQTVEKQLDKIYTAFMPTAHSITKELPKGLRKLGKRVGQLYMERKKEMRGVEPKFVSHKPWTPGDDTKLFDNPDHKFNQAAKAYLRDFLNGNLADDDPFRDAFVPYARQINVDDLRQNPTEVQQLLREYTHATQLKFQKKHFVKLDYQKKPGEKKVSRELERMSDLVGRKVPKLFKWATPLIARAYMQATKNPVRDVNYGAVTECMANEIYEILGFGGSKLAIIEDQYEDGTPKLYLDSTEARGPKGEKPHTFKDSILKEYPKVASSNGRFENNQVMANGRPVPIDTAAFAKGLAPALLMGDYDKWGSGGDNLLFYVDEEKNVAVPLNIDPGKALAPSPNFATDRLKHENMHSNLSFENPTATYLDKRMGGYKNFTLFMDTKLSERMEGIKAILDDEKWGKIEKLFDNYIERYGANRDDPDLNFAEDLKELKKVIQDRRAYFKQVFGKRAKLNAEQLDLVDNLEKLTSKTRSSVTVGTKKDKRSIDLVHLEVDPKTRREWNIEKEGNQLFLEYKAPSSDQAYQVMLRLQPYLERQGLNASEFAKVDNGNVRILLGDKGRVNWSYFTEVFAEDAIREFKGLPPHGAF